TGAGDPTWIGYGYNMNLNGDLYPGDSYWGLPATDAQINEPAQTVLAMDGGFCDGGGEQSAWGWGATGGWGFPGQLGDLLIKNDNSVDAGYDPSSSTFWTQSYDMISPGRHLDTDNVLFCDGHVKAMRKVALLSTATPNLFPRVH
ncbi:MAG: hypothetical protein ABI210_14830, partial [Abditibacteriaceae bacterium]